MPEEILRRRAAAAGNDDDKIVSWRELCAKRVSAVFRGHLVAGREAGWACAGGVNLASDEEPVP